MNTWAMCGAKQRYDKKSALTQINRIMRGRHNKCESLRAYPCPHCSGWHITKTK